MLIGHHQSSEFSLSPAENPCDLQSDPSQRCCSWICAHQGADIKPKTPRAPDLPRHLSLCSPVRSPELSVTFTLRRRKTESRREAPAGFRGMTCFKRVLNVRHFSQVTPSRPRARRNTTEHDRPGMYAGSRRVFINPPEHAGNLQLHLGA